MEYLLIAIVSIVVALVAVDFLLPATAARLALALERARSGMTTELTRVAGLDISYFHGGKGDTLLLLHGFGADKDNFVRAARHLRRRFRVIAVDLPGFGQSSRPEDRSYTIAEQAAGLHEIVTHLGLERFHLGGSSMGGAIAIDYAAAHPERVASLWLLAPAGVLGASDSEVIAEYRNHGRSLLVVERAKDFWKLLALVMQKPPFFPYSVKRTLGERAANDAPLHRRIFEELVTSAASEERGRAVGAPALIVWGSEDRVLDVSGAALLHAAMPASKMSLIDGIGHLPMLESPRRTARDYIDFVDG